MPSGPPSSSARNTTSSSATDFSKIWWGGGWLHLAPGQWTDDTAQTLALAESYVARGGLDLDDFAARLVRWYQNEPPDIGDQTRQVLEYLREYPARTIIAARKFWYKSGGTVAGNGSLMRCAPTAMFRWHDTEKLIRESVLASQVTHFDPRCTEACLVVNFIIMQCLQGQAATGLEAEALSFLRSLRKTSLFHVARHGFGVCCADRRLSFDRPGGAAGKGNPVWSSLVADGFIRGQCEIDEGWLRFLREACERRPWGYRSQWRQVQG